MMVIIKLLALLMSLSSFFRFALCMENDGSYPWLYFGCSLLWFYLFHELKNQNDNESE